jgi:hypothetical protein
MEVVYLKNGQSALLEKKIDDENYLVSPSFIYYEYDGQENEDWGQAIVVKEIFSKPPVENISKEFLNKLDSVQKKTEELKSITKEVDSARHELGKIERQKTDLSKLIFNRSEFKNAETIAAFSGSNVEPFVLSEKLKKNLRISIEILLPKGEERAWVYKIYDDWYGSSNYVDQEYGFLFDKSEEELAEIARKRADKLYDKESISNWNLLHADENFLSDRLIEIKNGEKKKAAIAESNNIKAEIEKNKEKLKKLELSINI